MELDTYLNTIESQQIPDHPPSRATVDGYWTYLPIDGHDPNDFLKPHKIRRACIELGLWIIIDKAWTKILADWIGDQRVLEIMAGGGWLAKALNEHGTQITATDDYSWNDKHSRMTHVYPVQKLHALEAVATIKADILLISWPPYGDETIMTACQRWGKGKPIIYIGEGHGGCNAPDGFFGHFKDIQDAPDIPLMSWDGLHDYVYIGYWT